MALLRQNGCPSVFLTLSCAEFDWPELLKAIVETVQRRKVTKEYIDNFPDKEKNRLISENVVQSTIHFQKRVDKLFTLMKYDFFKGSEKTYHVSSYFYRIEFQERGAPHVHSLLWIKDEDDKDAPSFWVDPNDPEKSFSQEILSKTDGNASKQNKNEEVEHSDEIQTRVQEIDRFDNFIISTSLDDIYCGEHELIKLSGYDDVVQQELPYYKTN